MCFWLCIRRIIIYIGIIAWETRRGVIYGELSPIYGIGAVIFVYLLARKKRKPILNFIYGALIGGTYEYLASFFQEKFAGTLSWDYTGYFLNINGRTTVPFMLVWGLLCVITLYVFYPWVSKVVEKIPYNIGKLLYKVLLIFVVFDMTISYSAAIRQYVRNAGYGPYTIVGEYLDKHYPNERLASIYHTAKFK